MACEVKGSKDASVRRIVRAPSACLPVRIRTAGGHKVRMTYSGIDSHEPFSLLIITDGAMNWGLGEVNHVYN